MGCQGALGQSLWLREVHGREEGPPPPLDLQAERRTGDFVRARILSGTVSACHDLSDGGLLVAVAEMAMAGGNGIKLDVPASGISPHAYWFGEDQGRYLLAVADGAALVEAARRAGIEGRLLGRSGGDGLTLPSGATISLQRLRQAHHAFFPRLMGR